MRVVEADTIGTAAVAVDAVVGVAVEDDVFGESEDERIEDERDESL